MRAPTGVKFCTMVSSRPNFIMPVQNFGNLFQKNFRGQNMQHLARFQTTLKFGGEYLWNGWRYSKSDKHVFDSDFSRVRQNKCGKVRSSNFRDFDVELYPLKAHFSEDHILAPKGCCVHKRLHALENDHVILAHQSMETSPPFKFFKGESKIGLKCS